MQKWRLTTLRFGRMLIGDRAHADWKMAANCHYLVASMARFMPSYR
jgi:hypothetical protein